MEESTKKHKRYHSFLTIATWAVLIGIWFFLTEFRIVDSVLLPSPLDVWETFCEILRGGYADYSLWQHLGTSFYRLFTAIFLAIIIAVPLGLLSGTSARVRAMVDSLMQFYRPLPPLAYYTLLILWFGIDDLSKVLLLFLAAQAPIYLACVSAVGEIPARYIQQAQILGASRSQIFFQVIFPASLPQIFVGIRTAVGVAYTTLVASEMVAATNGIGWMVLDASKYLRSDVIFVGIIILGLTGIMLDMSLRSLQERYVFWSPGMGKEAKAEVSDKKSFRLRQAFSTLFAIFLVVVIILSRFQDTQAGEQKVRIGLLRVPNDEMVAKAAGIIEREFTKKNVAVEFITFDSGVDANKAFSSKSIDFATMGHTNGLVALSTGLDVELIWLHEILGDVEALVAREESGISRIEDLAGKKVATVFASTSHYSLLSILREAGIENEVTLLDMQTPDIVAAWQRGDIDAAYTWQPSLAELMKEGEVLISSREVAERGNITANILLARKAFAHAHPEHVMTLLTCLREAGDIYRETPEIAADYLTRELVLTKEDLLFQMSGSRWLSAEEEISPSILGTEEEAGDFVKTLKNTADFLSQYHYIERELSYDEIEKYVNTFYIEELLRSR